jgi:OOP family OmpA-OmpF porin
MTKRLINAIALTLGAGILLTGCGLSAAKPTTGASVVVVAANESNAAPINDALAADGELTGLVATDATIHFVVPDGTPTVAPVSFNLAPQGNNSLIRKETAALEQAKLAKYLGTLDATTPQNNPLYALNLAANLLRGTSGTGPREIIVINSGLSTVAPLGFQNGILSDTPSQVVSQLKSAGELPDLAGIWVDWLGLGDVTGQQSQLTIAEQGDLKAIWTAILTASGAKTTSFNTSPLPGVASAALPPVTPTPVSTVASISAQMVSDLGSTSVHFVPGEATYLNPARAGGVLSNLAAQITSGGYRKITITGTAALPGYRALSLARAQSVATTLEDHGVPSSDVTTAGVGTHFDGFVADVINGQFDNALAELDRLVIVTASK